VDVAGLRVARAQRPARGEAVHRGHRHLQHDEVGQLRRAGLGAAAGGPLRSDTWHFRWRAGASTRPLLRSISMVSERRASAWTRLLRGLGLVHAADGQPLPGAPRRSRYGLYVSARLDQDLDDLRARLDALEHGGS